MLNLMWYESLIIGITVACALVAPWITVVCYLELCKKVGTNKYCVVFECEKGQEMCIIEVDSVDDFNFPWKIISRIRQNHRLGIKGEIKIISINKV